MSIQRRGFLASLIALAASPKAILAAASKAPAPKPKAAACQIKSPTVQMTTTGTSGGVLAILYYTVGADGKVTEIELPTTWTIR